MKTLSLSKCGACFTASVMMLLLAGCPNGDTTKKAVGAVTKKTVETAKGVMSGIAEGMDEGRKQTTGVDGASVVMTFGEMQGKVSYEILAMTEDSESGIVHITIGFSNITNAPIRVSGLSSGDSVMLLDKSGYVSRVLRGPLDVTIPAQAKERAELRFRGKAADFVTLRVLGGEVSLADVKVTSMPAVQ